MAHCPKLTCAAEALQLHQDWFVPLDTPMANPLPACPPPHRLEATVDLASGLPKRILHWNEHDCTVPTASSGTWPSHVQAWGC